MAATALILAAGRGTRMRSRLAKVLHPVLGWPMVQHAVDACHRAGLSVRLVVHHQEDAVRAALAGSDVGYSRQVEPRGTGDAVAAALADLPAQGVVVVLPGDAPLLRPQTLRRLLDAHGDALVTCLSVALPDGAEYGRIVRDRGGVRIVEAAELDADQRASLREVNTGVYAFDLAFLRQVVPTLAPHPPKGELYLTDALERAGDRARVLVHDGDPDEVMGVNDRWALARAAATLGERIKQAHAEAGVTFEDPATTLVEVGVHLGQDVVIGPGCVLRRGARVEDEVVVGAHCVLGPGTLLRSGATVRDLTWIEDAEVRAGAVVGPYARLRPGALVQEDAHVGNYCEVKASVIERGAKVNHLTYIGDAHVGAGTNVGAGTITCNYDGFAKHRTEIGPGAFIGSNTALVAPVRVGAGAIVAAGSTITEEVPDDALALGRSRQVNKAGMARRLRARNASRKERS